jgi:hypothetical protein
MTVTLKSVLPALAGFAAGGLSYALQSGRSLGLALLWGIGTAAIAAFIMWLTTLSNDKRKPEEPPNG